MRTLVTGAAGFIGSHLCRRLVADGHEVVALDDLSDGRLENLAEVLGVRFEEADLRDEEAVRAAAHGCSVVFHQGAMRSVPRSIELPEQTTDVNVRGTLNVLLAAREARATVVFASSSSVYGDQASFPLREDMAPLPRSPYAASKLAGEGLTAERGGSRSACRPSRCATSTSTARARIRRTSTRRSCPRSRWRV